MILNWEGLQLAYGQPSFPSNYRDRKNPGTTYPSTYVPIQEPQPTLSTLYEEYPAIDPYYTDEPERIVFHTTFGDYAFSKLQPSMAFTYRDSTPLIQHSVFYVNSSLTYPIILVDYSINQTRLSSAGIELGANLLSGVERVGSIRVTVAFDRVQKPKITAVVNPSAALSSTGFNVLWLVRGYGTFARFKEAGVGVDFANATLIEPQEINATRMEIGPVGLPESWRVTAVVDWSDTGPRAKIGFGSVPQIPFLAGPASVVVFPYNVAVIDPTIVGQSTLTGSAMSFQRRTFFDGSYYWAFYHDGSNTVYEYSSDGRTWSSAPVTLWAHQKTVIWYNAGTMYALAGTSSSATCASGRSCSLSVTVYLYFRKGTVSGTTVTWGSTVTIESYTHSATAYTISAEYRDVNLMVGSDGLITGIYTLSTLTGVMYYECTLHCATYERSLLEPTTIPITPLAWICCNSSSTASFKVRKSSNTSGSSWGSATTILSVNDPSDDGGWTQRYRPILTALSGGGMLAVFNDLGAIKYAKSTAWTSVTTLDSTAKNIDEFGSAVSDLAYTVHFVYVDSDDTIKYRSYNGSSWSGVTQIASATSKSPAIALGYSGDLHVLYLKSNIVYHVRYTGANGWGTAATPLGTSFTAPAHVTAGANATNGFLVALWTEGTASPYSIKLGSLPVQVAWSPYSVPTDPWDGQGLIPYGQYFQNLQEYVSPHSGLLTIVQTDFVLPGRGIGQVGTFAFTRVFQTPYTFQGTTPYNYEAYPYANLGLGWGLNLPWLGTDYLHLWNGQGYKITWTNNQFVNHKGEHFAILKNTNNNTYSLFEQSDASGTRYYFDSSKRLVNIKDRTGSNQLTFAYDASNRIDYITDTVNRVIDFTYDGNGRLGSVSTGGRVWTFGYNGNGNLVSVTDPLGRVTSNEYTSAYSSYLLTKITYPTTAYTTYAYTDFPVGTENKAYRATQQTTKLGDGTTLRQISYSYTVGNADRVTNSTLTVSNGTATQGSVKYDFESSKVTQTVMNSLSQTIAKRIDEYGGQGEIKKETIFLGGSSSSYTNLFRFDDWGNLVYERRHRNATTYRETHYSYANTNTQNRFVDFNGQNVTDFSNSFYVNTIDSNIHDKLLGRSEFQNGAGSNKIESYYKYSGQGNLLEQKSLLGTSEWLVTSYTYDSYGNVLTRTDPKGNQTTYEYSAVDYNSAYLTKITNVADGITIPTEFTYNFTTGSLVTVASPSGNVTDYKYDNIGRLTKIIHPTIGGSRAERRVSYDDANNVATSYDENNNYVKYYYDSVARLTKVETYSGGSVYSTETYTYYWNGKVRTRTDPTGNVTTYNYDFFGRTTKVTFADWTTRQWTYDDTNVKVIAYDGKNHPTDYYYDWFGRLIRATEYNGAQTYNTYYAYDRVGNLLQIKDALNQITSFTYDSLNRQTRTDFPDTTYETRTYDKNGNVISRRTQNNAVIQYSYDQINRLTKITYPDATTVTYAYDKDSNRLRMLDPVSTTIYTYDARGRLLSETRTIDSQNYALSYQHDAASNLIRLTYPDGYHLNYTYDELNRITQAGSFATLTFRKDNRISTITYGNGIVTTYSYDKLGRVTRILTKNGAATLLDLNYAYDANGNPTSLNATEETYTYDDLDRLTNATGPFGTLGYTYDAVGNRLSETVNGTSTNSYSYGSYNKLLSAGSTSFTYDNNGNTVSKSEGSNSWSYNYDYENRLRQVNFNGGLVFEVWYDGDGRRAKTWDSSVGTTAVHYIRGSWDPVFTKNIGSGVTNKLVFAGRLRIARIQGATSYFYHIEALGSVRLVTDTGVVQQFSARYRPFGASQSTSGNEIFRFTGKQLDASTGLYYFGYRYVDATIGRFIQADPLILGSSNAPQAANRYAYARNGPIGLSDPDGRFAPALPDPGQLGPTSYYGPWWMGYTSGEGMTMFSNRMCFGSRCFNSPIISGNTLSMYNLWRYHFSQSGFQNTSEFGVAVKIRNLGWIQMVFANEKTASSTSIEFISVTQTNTVVTTTTTTMTALNNPTFTSVTTTTTTRTSTSTSQWFTTTTHSWTGQTSSLQDEFSEEFEWLMLGLHGVIEACAHAGPYACGAAVGAFIWWLAVTRPNAGWCVKAGLCMEMKH